MDESEEEENMGMSITDWVLDNANMIKDETEQERTNSGIRKENTSKSDDEKEDEVFEVEQILKTKMNKGIRYFFVRWKGYDKSYDTWEPEENLDGSLELVREFMEDHEKKQTKKRKPMTPPKNKKIEIKEKNSASEDDEVDEHGNRKKRPKRSCANKASYEMPPSPTAYYRKFLPTRLSTDSLSSPNASNKPESSTNPNELLLKSIESISKPSTSTQQNPTLRPKKSKKPSRIEELFLKDRKTFDVWRHLLIFHESKTHITELTQLREFTRNQLSNLIDMSKKNPFIFLGGKEAYMLFGGFLYKRHRKLTIIANVATGDKSEWRCVSSPQVGCNAVVHSNGDQAESFALHNHPADFEGMEDAVWKYYGKDLAAAAAAIDVPSENSTIEPSSSQNLDIKPTLSQEQENFEKIPMLTQPKMESLVEKAPDENPTPIASIEKMVHGQQQHITQKNPTCSNVQSPLPLRPALTQASTQNRPVMTPPIQLQPQIMVAPPPVTMSTLQQRLPAQNPYYTQSVEPISNSAQKRPMEMPNEFQQPKRPYMPQPPMGPSGVMSAPISHPLPPQEPMMAPQYPRGYPQQQNFHQMGPEMANFGGGQGQRLSYSQMSQRPPVMGGLQMPPGYFRRPMMNQAPLAPSFSRPMMPPHISQMPNYHGQVYPPQQNHPRLQFPLQPGPIPGPYQRILHDPQLTGFKIKLLEQIRAAINKSEADGYNYRCFPNCERFAYQGYVYHLPTGRSLFCAKRTRKGEICTAQLKLCRDPNKPAHTIIAKHDHPKDYGFVLREISRQLLYNTILEKCDQSIFEKMYHMLKALFPEFLYGQVLPDFETVKHRVWNSALRDIDIERVKVYYRKIGAKNQPVINLDDDDQPTDNNLNFDDPLLPTLPFGVLPIYENLDELEEPDRRPLAYEEIMRLIESFFQNSQPVINQMPGPRQQIPPQNFAPLPGGRPQFLQNTSLTTARPIQPMNNPRQAPPQRPMMAQQGTRPAHQIPTSQPNSLRHPIRPPLPPSAQQPTHTVMQNQVRQIRAPIQTLPMVLPNQPIMRQTIPAAVRPPSAQPAVAPKNSNPETQNSAITLLAYVSDPLFFNVNGITKLAYRGDIYQLSYETPEFTFWHCDRKSCKARLKQVTSNNQFMFYHLCEHQVHMPPVYKINDVPVIRLNVLNPKIETPTFKHFSVPGMTIKKEHIMPDVPESILKTATVNVPNRVKPTQQPPSTEAGQSAQNSQPLVTNENPPKNANFQSVPNLNPQSKINDPTRARSLAKIIQTQYSQILKDSNDKPYLYVNGKERRLTFRGQIFVNHGVGNTLEKSYWACVHNIPNTISNAHRICSVNITLIGGKIQFGRDINHSHPFPGPALRMELLTFLVVRAATVDLSWTSLDARNVLASLNQGQIPTETRIGKWIAEQRARGKGFYDQLGFIQASLHPRQAPTIRPSNQAALIQNRPTQSTVVQNRPPHPTIPQNRLLQPPVIHNRPSQPIVPPNLLQQQNPTIRQALLAHRLPVEPTAVPAIIGQQALQRKPAPVGNLINSITLPKILDKKLNWEEEKWMVALDFPLLFPSKEDKELPRMAYQGNVYFKISAIDDFSLWKCEMNKNKSPQQPGCRATIEVAKGKYNLKNKHNHPENFKNMWTKLQNAGIDIAIYGVPKSEPVLSKKQKKATINAQNNPNSSQPTSSKEVFDVEDSDSDECQILLTPAATPISENPTEKWDKNEEKKIVDGTLEFIIEKVVDDEENHEHTGIVEENEINEIISTIIDQVELLELENQYGFHDIYDNNGYFDHENLHDSNEDVFMTEISYAPEDFDVEKTCISSKIFETNIQSDEIFEEDKNLEKTE